jgi:hypothetical protein
MICQRRSGLNKMIRSNQMVKNVKTINKMGQQQKARKKLVLKIEKHRDLIIYSISCS